MKRVVNRAAMKLVATNHMWMVMVAMLAALAPAADAQPLFRGDAPVEITLTTNLRDLIRGRDSTNLEWFGAEMEYRDDSGTVVRVPTELRARWHFRRQARNCAFPPLFLRTEREAREGTLLQGNPRLKIVTPCRPSTDDYRQYIMLEYLLYRTYAEIEPVHHRTRLANITYRDSTGREDPITVTAFFLEVEGEVADEHGYTHVEQTGAMWSDVMPDPLGRLALFEYWIGNTDWSLSALHNVSLFTTPERLYVPIGYDFDWSGAVNARYSFPNPSLGIRSVRDRLHRGPCWPAAQWAPIVAQFKAKRAAVDSVWATPIVGLEDDKRNDAKEYLDEFWEVLDDDRQFKREILDRCQKAGN